MTKPPSKIQNDKNEPNGEKKKRIITLPLLRKRSEHNASLISTLEELALHQEELESIGPILGRTCGKTLKILLLQNNVIDRMNPSDLKLCRVLEYLNLALNNIRKIEGVEGMEWLRKLDLTLNFIDLENLEESVENLKMGCRSLEELFLIGNPCMGIEEEGIEKKKKDGLIDGSGGQQPQKNIGWSGCRPYIIANLQTLKFLDGKEIKRSERIAALQKLPALELELHSLAEERRNEKALETQQRNHDRNEEEEEEYIPDDAPTHHNPETRLKLSNELHDQKLAKEKQESAHLAPPPKGEKEWEEEHLEMVKSVREREEEARVREETINRKGDGDGGHNNACSSSYKADGGIKQCNQGKYKFWFEEGKSSEYRIHSSNITAKTSTTTSTSIATSKASSHDILVMRIALPKYLSTTLVDVDIHPTYVSVVIKSKILRVLLPVEVISDRAVARRSTATGYLELIMPKVTDGSGNDVMVGYLGHIRDACGGKKDRNAVEKASSVSKGERTDTNAKCGITTSKKREDRLGDFILKEAGVVGEDDCLKQPPSYDKICCTSQALLLEDGPEKENSLADSLKFVNDHSSLVQNNYHRGEAGEEDDDPPPLC